MGQIHTYRVGVRDENQCVPNSWPTAFSPPHGLLHHSMPFNFRMQGGHTIYNVLLPILMQCEQQEKMKPLKEMKRNDLPVDILEING